MTGYHKNTGQAPRDKNASVDVIWANNRPARRSYTVSQLIWELRGWDFDIGYFKRAGV